MAAFVNSLVVCVVSSGLKLASEAVSGEPEPMAVEVADPPAQWLY